MHPEMVSQINSTFVVLAENGDAIPVAVSDRFYADLEHQFGDFKGKRLISHYTFEQDWNSWEMHPSGDEFVCLLSGQVDFVLQQNGIESLVSLNTPGDYILVPRGIWHTAKVHSSSSLLFITPGENTQHRSL
ncbi:WxcM-like domain-containing protein [Leptothermofonsia sichuanensis E412]|uniref:WxcM-like domain-containing protein n=1 Tax=Leptothermofonsia sichuanensis TaxID=2917832 RepID=UPI001CA65A18|nr:WxcM-like domain-containing protein [Leptothermofonsia sichuanensis]QZZ19644.1 WxcM-like domain-containing protein [Leptothermofonsia sichuanensis E412]